jgi:predicted negative regulator of RcsB-dependent stress response
LKTIVLTYGNTIYSQQPLSYGLVAHEISHVFQQLKMGEKNWWNKYLKDDEFRMQQELEAYQNQYQCYEEHKPGTGKIHLPKIAGDLSGTMYGNIVSLEEAKELIINENV